jgi:hypothetical protein
LLSGHQFHCRDGNDYDESEHCQPFQHGENLSQLTTTGGEL